ncbi:MAG: Crp/Fnr family transcriptional regulator, partial [Flavobacteriaceae bacterium]
MPLQTYYSVLDQFLKDNNLSLTQDELKKFISYFTVEKFKKKEHLVVVGQNSSNYFVLQGGLRMYYNLKFAFEGWWLGDVVSYINLTGAEYLVQAMEETIVIGITRKSQFEMFEEFPEIKDVYISELERALVWTFQRILDSTKNTANERFMNFMK